MTVVGDAHYFRALDRVGRDGRFTARGGGIPEGEETGRGSNQLQQE